MVDSINPRSKTALATMHALVILFGIGAWIAINGVWVELPVLITNPTNSAPEGWNLPSYLAALNQIANIGPLIVTLMHAFCSRWFHQNAMIYSILTMGSLSCLLLSFLWNVTAFVAGKEHSVALFSFFFILAFVDCTSSVTFLPFMSRFETVFLTTYFVGEGLSGFLPSIAALIQGASYSTCVNESFVNSTTNKTQYHMVPKNSNPRFSIEAFFGFLCFMMVCSTVAFFLINHTRTAKVHRRGDVSSSSSIHSVGSGSSNKKLIDGPYKGGKVVNEDAGSTHQNVQQTVEFLSRSQYVYFLLIIFWINCNSNGVLPSVSTYSSLPYGQLAYHLSATLSAMANPIACFIALFLPMKSHALIGVLTLITTGFGAYLMTLAVQSPCPVLVNYDAGAVLMVICSVVFVGTTSYIKVTIGQIFHKRGHKKALVWYGAVVQLGSMIGALTMFPIINVYRLFKSSSPCTTQCAF